MFNASTRPIRSTVVKAALLVAAFLTFAHTITQAQAPVRRAEDATQRNAAVTGRAATFGVTN